MSEAPNLRRRRLRLLRERLLRRRRDRKVQAAMTIMEHLGELRSRLIFSLVAFLVISVVAFSFYEPMLEFLLRPYCALPDRLQGPQGCALVVSKPQGGFFFRLKLTALMGIALSSPVWLYQIYAFVLPALTPKEKRYSTPFLLSSVALFALGAGLAYLTLPTGLRLLIGLAGSDVVFLIDAEQYLNFIGLMLLGFGLTFELPLVLIFLGLADVVTVEQLREQRRTAIVVIAVLAAIVTPSQDPYTMLVLAVPLYGLYEITLFVLARLTRGRLRRPAEAQ
jgi:sec-independent protein translocase protein TatC